jgi:hypothetical protein
MYFIFMTYAFILIYVFSKPTFLNKLLKGAAAIFPHRATLVKVKMTTLSMTQYPLE